MTAGKVWATAGFGLGVAVSVAGNIAHTWHPSKAVLEAAGVTADQWQPEIGAQLMAAFFPVALLVTVEVLARVAWPHTWGWMAARFGGTSLVALVAAVVSYMHLNGLLHAYGEDPLTALIGPLSVDGLMVVCGFALIAISRTATLSHSRPWVAEPARDEAREPLPEPSEQLMISHSRPVVADMVAALVARRPAQTEAVEERLVEANARPDFSHAFSHPADGSTAGQDPVIDLSSAIKSASAAGRSKRSIAEEFGLTRYQVDKILDDPAEAEPELVSATSTTPAD